MVKIIIERECARLIEEIGWPHEYKELFSSIEWDFLRQSCQSSRGPSVSSHNTKLTFQSRQDVSHLLGVWLFGVLARLLTYAHVCHKSSFTPLLYFIFIYSI